MKLNDVGSRKYVPLPVVLVGIGLVVVDLYVLTFVEYAVDVFLDFAAAAAAAVIDFVVIVVVALLCVEIFVGVVVLDVYVVERVHLYEVE